MIDMNLPHLSTRTIESDPYRTVVIHSGAMILAECNGSSKADVAAEIARRCNMHNKLLDRFSANEELLAYIATPSGRRFAGV